MHIFICVYTLGGYTLRNEESYIRRKVIYREGGKACREGGKSYTYVCAYICIRRI